VFTTHAVLLLIWISTNFLFPKPLKQTWTVDQCKLWGGPWHDFDYATQACLLERQLYNIQVSEGSS